MVMCDTNVYVCMRHWGYEGCVIVYDMKPSEYKFSWLKWISYIGWKCACESVLYLKGEALLHYEKYDMIVCYIIMTCEVSVIWMQ